MKIAVVADDYPSTAFPLAGAFIHARARMYVARGHDVRVFTSFGAGSINETEYEGIPIARVKDPKDGAEMLSAWLPDVVCVHAPVYGSFAYSLGSSGSFPTLAWIHGYEALLTAFYGYHISRIKQVGSIPRDMLRLFRLRRLLRRIQGVVYVSRWMQTTAERFLLGYHHPGTFLIPNPVDTDLFVPRGEPLTGKPRGLCVRSLGNWKYGVDTAIKAFSGIEETSLTVFGDGALRGVYERMVEKLGSSVEIIPKVYHHREMPKLYPQYDYFVAPSRTEAQGVAMCEAMSCGLPVVACGAGGIPEFVDDGIDGYLVAPNDSRALAERIRRLVADREALIRMGRKAREHVLAKCSKHVVAEMEEEAMRFAVRCFYGR